MFKYNVREQSTIIIESPGGDRIATYFEGTEQYT